MNGHSPHFIRQHSFVDYGGLILWPIIHERTFIVRIHMSIAKRSLITLYAFFKMRVSQYSRNIPCSFTAPLSFVQLPASIICSSLNRIGWIYIESSKQRFDLSPNSLSFGNGCGCISGYYILDWLGYHYIQTDLTPIPLNTRYRHLIGSECDEYECHLMR